MFKIINKIENRFKKADYVNAYLLCCQAEQILSDILIMQDNYFDILKDLRRLCIKLAKIAFFQEKKNISKLYSHIIKKIELLPKPKQNYILIKSRKFFIEKKFPECFQDFGIYPEDFLKLKVDPNKYDIIGLRTAGSYLAPLISVAVNSKNYITFRPGFRIGRNREGNIKNNPFILSLNENKALRKIISRGNKLIIVDEGPGTGSTFNCIVKFFLKKGVPKNDILVISTRPYKTNLLNNENRIFIRSNHFIKICKTGIPKLEKILNANFLSIEKFETKEELRTYSNPKSLIKLRLKNGVLYKIIGKFVGVGLFGEGYINNIRKIKNFAGNIIYFSQGVLFIQFESLKYKEKSLDKLIKLNLNYALYRKKKLHFDKNNYSIFIKYFIDLIKSNNLLDWNLQIENSDDIIQIITYLVSNMRSKYYFKGDIDWRLEKIKWFRSNRNIIKLDMFHCNDYANHPKTNILVQIVGFMIEFGYKNKICKLAHYLRNKAIFQNITSSEILLSALYYLFWKINYYSYIINNLEKYTISIEYFKKRKEYLDSNFKYFIKNYKKITEND